MVVQNPRLQVLLDSWGFGAFSGTSMQCYRLSQVRLGTKAGTGSLKQVLDYCVFDICNLCLC